MKKLLFVPSALALCCATLHAATTPLFQERFNDSGNIEYVNGAAQGPDKSGVSGKPNDKSYFAHVEVVDPAQPQPAALLNSSPQAGDLQKFTVTLWYKADRAIKDPDSLFSIGGLYLIYQEQRGLTLRVEVPKGAEPFANWFSGGIKGPLLPSDSTEEWIFYAISWDLDAKICTIYQGTKNDPATVQKEIAGFDLPGPVQPTNTRAIGNNFNSQSNSVGDRPFSGNLDNFRIYDKTLDQSAIEAIRTADVANAEPTIP